MYLFLLPFMPGLLITGLSAFTAFFSRLWGAKKGQMATAILRNLIGIPLWLWGFIWAFRLSAPLVSNPGSWIRVLAWGLILLGSIPILWGHLILGFRTHMPSVKDTLVTSSLYAYVRHPIYAGGFPFVLGLALLKPTGPVIVACALLACWFYVQARLEEMDLFQRLPAYADYMKRVPRFIPHLTKDRK